MRPEEKVVSLETAKKLKEAGFPQDTERWWNWHDGDEFLDQEARYALGGKRLSEDAIAAPDAQELAAQFPLGIFVGSFKESPTGFGKEFVFVSQEGEAFISTNEAEARAACWLWLKENKLI